MAFEYIRSEKTQEDCVLVSIGRTSPGQQQAQKRIAPWFLRKAAMLDHQHEAGVAFRLMMACRQGLSCCAFCCAKAGPHNKAAAIRPSSYPVRYSLALIAP